MSPLSQLALVVAVLIGGAVGGRILLAAWRAGRMVERAVGAAVTLTALGFALEIGQISLAERLPGASTWLYGAVQLPHAIAAALAYGLAWRMFHPDRGWVKLAAILGAVGVGVCWALSFGVAPGTTGPAAMPRLALQAMRLGAYAWVAWASIAYGIRLHRQHRLGLVDAVVPARLLLGGIAEMAVAAILALMMIAEQRHGVRMLDWPFGAAVAAPLGALASISFYVAFFPPAFFRRWLEREREGGRALDRILPIAIREGDVDVLRRGRLVVLIGLAALVWGPVFAMAMVASGESVQGALLLAHVGLIAVQPVVLRITGSVVLASNLILLSLFGLALRAGLVGGIAAPALFWVALLPIGGALLAGRRSGIAWSVVSVASVIGVYGLGAVSGGVADPVPGAGIPPSVLLLNLLAFLSVITVVTLRSTRERELAIEQMRAARDDAAAAGAAKMRFLATMSHELRTPMNGALGMSELLLATDLSAEQKRLAEGIGQCGGQLLALIDDILEVSRIESGRMPLEHADFALRDVLDAALEVVADVAAGKGLALLCSVDPDVPTRVGGDPGRLRQVLVNLLGNAVKFTEQGEVELRVRALQAPLPKVEHALRFDVIDTGIGVAPERREQIFEAFTQEDESTTRRFGGTGLGLAIVKQLVDLMGGEVGVQPNPQGGSDFWFTLSFTRAKTQDQPVAVAPSETGRPEPARRASAPARILVVEDNTINQEVVSSMLELLGHEAELANNGREALQALERERFDVVLMDCQMPELDGFDATRMFREREDELEWQGALARRTPVIAVTANALQGDLERCIAAGMDGYLGKPFGLEQLAEVLERWVGHSGTVSGNQGSPSAG